MLKLILSPVGTSIFTNFSNENQRQLINKNANSQESEVSDKVKELINGFQVKAYKTFEKNDLQQLKKSSAELNSLLTFYKNSFEEYQRDVHVLITTDTFLGKKSADILKEYLDKYFETVIIYTPSRLSTKTKENFDSGIRNLLKWCNENLNIYRENQYEIVFNLTGGFKSLQGYLNTIGMFYANEIVYIFEKEGELISIPRLPIKIETDLFKNHAVIFLQLSQTNIGLSKNQLSTIPEIMIEEYQNGRYILSNWGELSWNNAKKEILSQNLIDLPLIEFSDSFKTDFKNTQRAGDKVVLQEKIANVSCLLQENKGNITCLKGGKGGGMLYDNYIGTNSRLGHFRINQGRRVSCEYKDQKLILRHYGEHDYVNDRP